ncbi:dormancy-associated protein 2-like [Diospyros lotus]|uniref:dormancy-associated protein 2-like n=1 Tax=Diospyros lotus TaxID=55363 RepID=UPI00224E1BF3|nr:dormancy-associated protein 2-like [Diospyros lotus]
MTSPLPSKLFLLLLLLLILLLHHPDTLSYPSQSLLVSASDQEPKIVEDHGNIAETANETSNAEITAIDRLGGGAGGHGGGGHSASRGGGRGGGRGRYRGYVGVIPLYAAGAGGHHPNGNHHHGGATNYGCPSYLLAYAILASVLVLLAS